MSEVEHPYPQGTTESSRGATAHAGHTPGPWRIDEEWGPSADYPDWGCVRIGESSVSGHAGPANIRLIAAAPDLLAACKELIASWLATYPSYEDGKAAQDAWSDRRAKARNDAEAAILKAEGNL